MIPLIILLLLSVLLNFYLYYNNHKIVEKNKDLNAKYNSIVTYIEHTMSKT